MIKVCIARRSERCFRIQTVQPYKDSRRIQWICPSCSRVTEVKTVTVSSLVRKITRTGGTIDD